MNLSELKQTLIEEGWDEHSCPRVGEEYYKWHLVKKMQSKALCLCNDRPPSYGLDAYSIELTDKDLLQIEIRIFGEVRKGYWIEYKFYSMTPDEFYKGRKFVMRKLKKAWETARA